MTSRLTPPPSVLEMNDMRLCVTGGSGFVGSNIVHTALATRQAQVLATSRTWRGELRPYPCLDIVNVDMRDADQFAATIADFKPTVVVHCAIDNTNYAAMERDHRIAWRSFVDPIVRIADIVNRSSARLILVSTDWVFDGLSAPATEDAPTSPVNLYGRMKLAAEMITLRHANRGSVARISGVNGKHRMRSDFVATQNQGYGNFVYAAVDTLLRGDAFEVWTGEVNEIANPSHATECAEMILRIADRDLDGVYHCCGSEAIGRVELARSVAAALALPTDRIVERPDFPTDGRHRPIPRDTSLDNTATRAALDYEPMILRQMIDAVIGEQQPASTATNQPGV